jgi:hypothetical protein
MAAGWNGRVMGLTEATMSMSSSPLPGFLTLTSSIFQPPLVRVSRHTMALPLLEDILLFRGRECSMINKCCELGCSKMSCGRAWYACEL